METKTIRHIRIIAGYYNRYILRSGSGLVYLLIALIFGLTSAGILTMPVDRIIQQKQGTSNYNPQSIRYSIINLEKPLVQWALGSKSVKEIGRELPQDLMNSATGKPIDEKTLGMDPWTAFLLVRRPAILSALFLVLIFGMPFAISFLAYDQLSGDIRSRGLRYLLLKTERANIYFGRFMGTAMFSTIVMAGIIGVVAFYLGAKIRIYPVGELFGWSVHGFLALSIQMLPYIAVCSMISAAVDSSMLSLIVAKLVIGGVLLFAVVGPYVWKPAKYIIFLLPWGCQDQLLHPSPWHLLLATSACVAYTAVFLTAGYYIFTRRDL